MKRRIQYAIISSTDKLVFLQTSAAASSTLDVEIDFFFRFHSFFKNKEELRKSIKRESDMAKEEEETRRLR
jgi:hypothetical protein